MNRPTRAIVLLFAAALVSILTVKTSAAQNRANKACGLVTEPELLSALGSKPTMTPDTMGTVQTCGGETTSIKVLVRVFTRTTDPSGRTEQAGIEAIKKMGGQVDAKTVGGIMCMTVIPPANRAMLGFATTCTVTSKAPTFAVIEVTAKAQKDMVPMEKLRALAEKMAARL